MSDHAVPQEEELKPHGEALRQAVPEPTKDQGSEDTKPAPSGTEEE